MDNGRMSGFAPQTQGIRPVEVRSAVQGAAQAIRDAIITGILKPGQRLVGRSLSASLGVGLPTVREALKELAHQGLVQKNPRRRTFVSILTEDDYMMLAEVRYALEALAIEKAAPRLTPEAESELRT
jgi:DNA-binding GntR family transcriptional regulator